MKNIHRLTEWLSVLEFTHMAPKFAAKNNAITAIQTILNSFPSHASQFGANCIHMDIINNN